MERRSFIKKGIAATSACSLAGVTALASNQSTTKKKTRCRVTVLKKEYYKEYYEQYKGKPGKPCPLFEVGQVHILKNWWGPPKGFCEWAWADMRPFVQQIFNGKEVTVVCCTDGFRPVVFKLERFEEEIEA